MADETRPDITTLLEAWHLDGTPGLDRLMARIWDDLHQRARGVLARQGPVASLCATEIVGDVYLRLRDSAEVDWQNRAHFFAYAVTVMRRILVDHVRERQARKRGGGAIALTLTEGIPGPGAEVDVLDLHEALEELAGFDAELAQLVELRYFAGLTVQETSEVLGLGTATVSRRWATARAWLYGRLTS